MSAQPAHHLGFSLIELLVVITISLLILGGSIAAFSSFSDKRSVITAVDELKTYFQTAQNRASAGDLGGCDQLSGYRVLTYLAGNTTELSLRSVCSAGTADAAQIFTFASGVTISPNIDATFQVLNAGVALPGNVASLDITVANDLNEYIFALSREGRMSEGAWGE